MLLRCKWIYILSFTCVFFVMPKPNTTTRHIYEISFKYHALGFQPFFTTSLHDNSLHHLSKSSAEMITTDSDVSLHEVNKHLTALLLSEPEPPVVSDIAESDPGVVKHKTKKTRVSGPSFFRLPAELRLHIYGLVLTQKHCLSPPKGIQVKQASTQASQKSNLVALLLVNRQIHLETRRLPFQLNTFILGDPYEDCFVHRKVSFIDYFEDILQPLQDWQKCEIRHLELSVTEAELHELCIIELMEMISRYRQGVNEVEGQTVWVHLEMFTRACGQGAGLQERVHWITSCLRKMVSMQKVTVAGTEITLDKEEVLRFVLPRPWRKACHG